LWVALGWDGQATFHDSEEAARDQARRDFEEAEENADDGWPQNTPDICYAQVIERLVETARKPAEPGLPYEDDVEYDFVEHDTEFVTSLTFTRAIEDREALMTEVQRLRRALAVTVGAEWTKDPPKEEGWYRVRRRGCSPVIVELIMYLGELVWARGGYSLGPADPVSLDVFDDHEWFPVRVETEGSPLLAELNLATATRNAHQLLAHKQAEELLKAIRDRDEMWCGALLQLDTRDIERVTRSFNQMRDERLHAATSAVLPSPDEDCPKDDPDCMGRDDQSHDACERPPEIAT
jgi:hypothetical protein